MFVGCGECRPATSTMGLINTVDSTASTTSYEKPCDTLTENKNTVRPASETSLPNIPIIKDTLTIEKTPSVFVGPSGQIYIIFSRDSLYIKY